MKCLDSYFVVAKSTVKLKDKAQCRCQKPSFVSNVYISAVAKC